MMLTPRRIEIFKAIVDEFVQTAEPVGSKTLMEKYQLPYSSATIRNDMMVLEEMGLLEKHIPPAAACLPQKATSSIANI